MENEEGLAATREIEAAARAFLLKLEECEPHINGAFAFQQIHGSTYQGPNYAQEKERLARALSLPPIRGGEGS